MTAAGNTGVALGDASSPTCRQAGPGDAEQIVSLVRTVYGDNYSFPWFYDVGFVRSLAARDNAFVTVAERDGEVVSLLVAEEDERFPGTLLLGSLMTAPGDRTRGAAELTHRFLLEGCDLSRFRSISLVASTAHTVSQHLAASFDFDACGMVLNGFLCGRIPLGVEPLASEKRSDIIAVKNLGVTDVGVLHVCERLRKPVAQIYSSLGVSFRLSDAGTAGPERDGSAAGSAEESQRGTELVTFAQPTRRNVDIVVRYVGADAPARVRAALASIVDDPLLSVQVYVSLMRPGAVALSNALLADGFRFCGVKPLGFGEYVLFNKTPHLVTDFGSCKVLDRYRPLFSLVVPGEAAKA